MSRILVTGGAGAIGSLLVQQLAKAGWRPHVFDTMAVAGSHELGDIRHVNDVDRAVREATGVVHLAAVSRVGWGEDDPEKCWAVNVAGTRNVTLAATSAVHRPWVLFASSREVYGNPERLPVVEDDPIAPVNTYGRSKAEGERVIAAARSVGLRCASIRLPSVYGSVNDIPERVIPALVARALRGQPLRLTGAGQLCDFLHVRDAVEGLLAAAKRLAGGARDLPTTHLASGQGTSLGELATLIKRLSGSESEIVEDPPRPFDVRGFVGDPARARTVLDWKPTISLEEGMQQFILETTRDGAKKSRGAN